MAADTAVRYSTGDLPILSAEVYTPGFSYGRPATTKKSSPPSTRSSEEGPRKRVKTQPSTNGPEREEEEKKRARGRPRLDVKDETAADRRRTQIRLAQRAYRNRKENAIHTLEKRVQELKDANEEMSNVFLQLHDFAVSTGALDRIPEFGRQLRATTEKFLALARKASEEGSKEDEAANSSSGDNAKRRKISAPATRKESSSPEPVQRTQQDVDTSARKPQPLLYGGFTITHEPLNDADLIADLSNPYVPPSTSSFNFEVITQPTLENASFPFGAAPPEFDFSSFSHPSPSPYNPLPLPKTYTSEEATFGRRLQRFASERALVLISMSDPPAERFQRVFGFRLLLETKDQILAGLRRSVDRTATENLSNWKYPFYNLGGAGTHFSSSSSSSAAHTPPSGNQGTRDIFKPHSTSGFALGPFNQSISNIRDTNLDKDMRMGLDGFEGDFFDCDDVELYLRQRGVTIPPGADHVTVEIDPSGFGTNFVSSALYPFDNRNTHDPLSLLSPPTSGVTSSSLSPTSSSDSSIPTTTKAGHSSWSGLVDPMLDGIFQTTGGSYMGLTVTSGASDFGGINSSGLLVYGDEPRGAKSRRERVMVDVNLLIKNMTKSAICLGRSPGFRPADVDAAFLKAARGVSA